MFDVAKVIRILGYIVYVILWLPVIILVAVFVPIWATIKCIKMDMPASTGVYWFIQALKRSIAHDMNFIETGVW